jgi:hypothetical protein
VLFRMHALPFRKSWTGFSDFVPFCNEASWKRRTQCKQPALRRSEFPAGQANSYAFPPAPYRRMNVGRMTLQLKCLAESFGLFDPHNRVKTTLVRKPKLRYDAALCGSTSDDWLALMRLQGTLQDERHPNLGEQGAATPMVALCQGQCNR